MKRSRIFLLKQKTSVTLAILNPSLIMTTLHLRLQELSEELDQQSHCFSVNLESRNCQRYHLCCFCTPPPPSQSMFSRPPQLRISYLMEFMHKVKIEFRIRCRLGLVYERPHRDNTSVCVHPAQNIPVRPVLNRS